MKLSAGSELPKARAGRTYGLYVHIPFCEYLCAFCSFYRMLLEPQLAVDYCRAVRSEMRMYGDLGYRFDTLYVGGGTPTAVPDEVAAIIALARRMGPLREVSVETNPDHLTPATVEKLTAVAVDRLSVGVQTFDDALLESQGRRSLAGERVRDKVGAIMGTFPTLNVDMIFNLPGQSMSSLRRDLAVIREIRPEQVTYYPLIGKDPGPEGHSRQRRMYREIVATLGADYRQSTGWCFTLGADQTRATDEYIAAGTEYAGLGAGSFGYLDGRMLANTFSVREYIDRLNRGRAALAAARVLTRAERAKYTFLMRLFAGRLPLADLAAEHGPGYPALLWPELLFGLFSGAARIRRGTLTLTPRGRYYWVLLMQEFFAGIGSLRNRMRLDHAPEAAGWTDRRR